MAGAAMTNPLNYANLQLTLYSLAALVTCLLVWFDIFEHADVVRLGNHVELVLSTVASSVGIFTCIIGWAGILLNNRGFLAWYTFFCWVTFGLLVAPGYTSYRRRRLNLEGKINAQWSQQLGSSGRARIQDQLNCCGYFSPFVEATITQTCYSRSVLPGCKLPYLKFQRKWLGRWALIVFSIVPAHLTVTISALLCSNHITYRFGKGMMPEAYRLNPRTMSVIMENYAECVIVCIVTLLAALMISLMQTTGRTVWCRYRCGRAKTHSCQCKSARKHRRVARGV